MGDPSGQTTMPGILFVVPWAPQSLIGGVSHAVLQLMGQIKTAGEYKSYLLISGGPVDTPPIPNLDTKPYHVRLRDPVWPGNRIRVLGAWLFTLPWVWWRLWTIVRNHSIRMVICEFPCASELPLTLFKRIGLFSGNVVLRLHGADILLALQSQGLERFLHRHTYRTADWIVACSDGLRDDVLRLDPSLDRRTIVIRHGIHSDAFRAKAEGMELPESVRNQPFLLNIARFEHKKAQDVLIAAFERIADRFPDLLLVLIGDTGSGSEVVAKRVRESPVHARIRMFEKLPNETMPVFLEAALMFVLPSRREGLGIVLLEAGACRKPVVATACTGIVDVIHDGITGRLVPVDDAVALADAIADLINDPEARERLAGNLYRSVREDFTWEHAYKKFVRLDRNSGGGT